jgi:hypothetical protein
MDIVAEHTAFQQQLEAQRAARNDPHMDHSDLEQVETDTERGLRQLEVAYLERQLAR